MTNKVVTTIAKTFDQLGAKTVRFNFRGVGQSEGFYNEGVGEFSHTEDHLPFGVRENLYKYGFWLGDISGRGLPSFLPFQLLPYSFWAGSKGALLPLLGKVLLFISGY